MHWWNQPFQTQPVRFSFPLLAATASSKFATSSSTTQLLSLRSTMIYDVKSEYYAQFLSSKQGPSASKSKPGPAAVVPDAQPAPDAMDTED